jgi:hypothetical protein
MLHKDKTRRIIFKAKQYLKENWGAPFIIAFMIMLMICACLLASGNDTLANEIAVYAYYSLVIGVVLQLVTFIREECGRPKQHADES